MFSVSHTCIYVKVQQKAGDSSVTWIAVGVAGGVAVLILVVIVAVVLVRLSGFLSYTH